MKKVLALVLAVIMVCTMAMAAVNAVDPVPVDGANGEIGEILLSSLKEEYVLVLDEEFFAPLHDGSLDITKDNFAVTANAKGSFVVFEDGTKAYAFDVENVDRALDGKVDFAITSLKISLVGSRNSYVTYEAKDGKLVATEYKLGGLAQGKQAIADINDAIDFYSAYDVGYETNNDMDNVQASWNDDVSPVWNMFNKDMKDNVIYADRLMVITLTGVPKNTPFKFVATEVKLTSAGAKALDKNLAANGDPRFYIVSDRTLAMTTGEFTVEIEEDEDLYIYTYDKNGKLTEAGFQFNVEKDPRTGVETGSWSLTTNSLGALFVSYAPLTASTAGSTEGATTNPGTGANDVVGVAAALAVVALISGAALSLKK